MLDSKTLNALLEQAFTGQISWLEASNRFPLDELFETFYDLRERVEGSLDGLTDAQVAYASPAHPIWSISESVTHLIYSQGFYYNKLLDLATSDLPHTIEAARGFGEGAKPGQPADELRQRLTAATGKIRAALEATRSSHDPNKTEKHEFFGVCAYRTWVLLLIGHEVDHLRQIIAMRRLARAEKA
jgi:hypothetical protein